MTKITFLRVETPDKKLKTIGRTVEKHYLAGDRILVATSNEQAAAYVDKLLWREPLEGMVPHHISHTPCHYDVVITTSLDNVNAASVVINLTEETHPSAGQVTELYELLDVTTPAKEASTQKKMQAYRKDGFKDAIQTMT